MRRHCLSNFYLSWIFLTQFSATPNIIMSFTEKIGQLMQRPGQDAIPNDDVPWWMKYAGRGLGTVGGGIAIFLGIWAATGILFAQIDCLIAGIWQMISLPAVVLCLSLSTIFGSGLIFGTGVIYGMMSLGKKASAEEMRTKAAAGVDAGPGGVAPDVQSHMKSSLVDNAQPVAFTGSPYDSNV
ncbi:hypothetical protein FOCC_FOCC007839 [Frankliniella occidentalis]|nr:hypothetical protein FOCC_FOCC007839 [Frankliniella occidentalis]